LRSIKILDTAALQEGGLHALGFSIAKDKMKADAYEKLRAAGGKFATEGVHILHDDSSQALACAVRGHHGSVIVIESIPLPLPPPPSPLPPPPCTLQLCICNISNLMQNIFPMPDH
jgi:hypothetical protein